ncbi:MAG: M3 family metallopeptidase [Burkholderiaceae bacterium]
MSVTRDTTNPLLQFDGLMNFAAIRPEHVGPAINTLLAAARAAVTRATDPATTPGWESIVEPLDDASESLARAWGAVSHLNAVVDTPELRAVYNALLPEITEFWTEVSQNEVLFAKYKAIAEQPDFSTWPAARRKIIANELRDFRLGGADLPPEPKARLAQLNERSAQAAQRFSENVLDATNAFSLTLPDTSRLAGLPADVIESYREAAGTAGGYKITLHIPSYLPALQYASDRALREELYRAYVTRASEFGQPEWDNSPLMTELLELRAEEARLLGYQNFAEVSLVAKMAESPAEVLNFLRDLARRSRPHAERDMAELRQFAQTELDLAELMPWDIAFVSEKLREKRYAYSEQDVKQYFTEPTVLTGFFALVESLFSVTIRPQEAPVWHPEVKFFRIENPAGELVAQFYLDLYARDHKRGGAWMDDERARRVSHGRIQTPIAFLTCNFARPVGGKPALLTHDDVLTLFHEFGHGLHHMLTRVGELGVAGIRGVEWDAVELPSQFMENFAWEWGVLQSLSSHVETGSPLPRELFDKMIAAKNFQSGMQMVRQLEFALFDMLMHADFDPQSGTVQDLLAQVRREVAVIFPPDYNRFANSFSHIFGGGYAAGYYSYKWAEVLSADAFSMFEENGVLDPATGRRFLDEILSVGGSRPAMESFIAFRGRKPEIDALLRHSGMAA